MSAHHSRPSIDPRADLRPCPRRRRRSRIAVAARTLLAVGALALVLAVAPASGAATVGPLTIAPTKIAGLIDGEVVDIALHLDDGGSANLGLNMYMCRPGVSYASYQQVTAGAGNCIGEPGTGSIGFGDAGTVAGVSVPMVDGNATLPWAFGTGEVEWFNPVDQTQKFSLTCDASHPCTLVATYYNFREPDILRRQMVLAVPLTFALTPDPLAGCANRGTLKGSHPFRLNKWWANETQHACASGTGVTVTAGVAGGEDETLTSYGSGGDDITYTGVGYQDPSILGAIAQRPSVAVPIGINATVLGFLGHHHVDGQWTDWADVKVTTDELGYLLSGSQTRLADGQSPSWADIVARNPSLQEYEATRGSSRPEDAPESVGGGRANGPMVLSNGDATTWLVTRYLASVMGADWRVASAGDTPDPRGVSFQFSTATPAFNRILTETGIPAMAKIALAMRNPRAFDAEQKPWPVVTDLATARYLQAAPAAISTGKAGGDFVAPTPATMTQAVGAMKKDDSGMRIPSATPVAGGGYQLTFVEYALVPVAPASAAVTCGLRSWLNYVTGPGQTHLPDGMVPLTADLTADAKEAIAKVGSEADAVACGQAEPPPVTPPTGPGSGGGTGGGFGSGSGSGSGTGSSSGSGSGSYGAVDIAGESGVAGESAASSPASSEPPIAVVAPDYAGNRTAGAFVAVLALLLVGGLSTVAALHSAGKAPWQRSKDPADDEQFMSMGTAPDDELNVIELR